MKACRARRKYANRTAKNAVLTLSVPPFVAMKVSPNQTLVVLDFSFPFVFLTSCVDAVCWGSTPVIIVQSVIVFTNVGKLILFHHYLTALLLPSFGTVRIVLARLQNSYDHKLSTFPSSGFDLLKKLK